MLNRIMMIIRILLVHLIAIILKVNNHRQIVLRLPNRIVRIKIIQDMTEIIKIIQDMKEILINMIEDIIEKKLIPPNPIHHLRK
jgi:hypothetical protein